MSSCLSRPALLQLDFDIDAGRVLSQQIDLDQRVLGFHLLGERGVPRPFGRSDVAFVAAVAEGQNDGPNWVCVGKLLRGEWFVVAAGCDYTGWGCQQSGQATLSRDLDAIVRLGLGDDERERLMPVPAHEMFARAGAGEDE